MYWLVGWQADANAAVAPSMRVKASVSRFAFASPNRAGASRRRPPAAHPKDRPPPRSSPADRHPQASPDRRATTARRADAPGGHPGRDAPGRDTVAPSASLSRPYDWLRQRCEPPHIVGPLVAQLQVDVAAGAAAVAGVGRPPREHRAVRE